MVPPGESLFSLRRKDSIAGRGQSTSVYKRASFVGTNPNKASRSVLGGSFFKKEQTNSNQQQNRKYLNLLFLIKLFIGLSASVAQTQVVK